ncbi:unnamed protein product [Ambrosiozyma monospora]|uniref:Unnamed protein product n=1 Tax=Ambrosiozyma monospora TaxID=43982 RepID=A0ACB5TPI1_AMBMO|nr:unnamed protein product [Ambrosiozyma monospora]
MPLFEKKLEVKGIGDERPKPLVLKLVSLEELDVRGFPFRIRGCPNLKKLTFSAFYTSNLYLALKYLQQLSIAELEINEIEQFLEDELEADKKTLELIIPSSVQRLTLISVKDEESFNSLLPYVVLLPPILESLVIKDLGVVLSNIHELIWLEKIHLSCQNYSYFFPIISRLPSTVKELEVTHIIGDDILTFPDPPKEKVCLSHLLKLESLAFSGYGFLFQFTDLPKTTESLKFKISLGYTFRR